MIRPRSELCTGQVVSWKLLWLNKFKMIGHDCSGGLSCWKVSVGRVDTYLLLPTTTIDQLGLPGISHLLHVDPDRLAGDGEDGAGGGLL